MTNTKLIKLAGRPTIMTPEIIAQLEKAFSFGYSDLEACFHCNISKSTLYNFQNSNPEFVERKEALKQSLSLKAKMAICEAIENGCVQTSKWWLERKCKEEFSLRSELSGVSNKELIRDVIFIDDI